MSEPNPTHVIPVLASTAAELIDSALGKITEQAVADMLAKIAKLTAERDDAGTKLAECRKVLDDISAMASTNAGRDPDNDQTITLNFISDLAGETLESTKP